MEIDAVFTWIDGERRPDLALWRDRQRGLLDAGDADNRWRDNGELRYALRALAANAPWLRRVHLVTAGEVPDWLDRSAPGLRVVTHGELFPDPSVLPTFNSVAIAAVLHRIPGLADRYLYFNDDVVLGRPVLPADFLTDDCGTKVYVEPWAPPFSLTDAEAYVRMLSFNAMRLAALGVQSRMLAHTAFLFERSRVEEVWARFAAAFDRTLTSRFRASDDAVMPFLYLNVLLAEGAPHLAVVNRGDARMIMVGRETDLASALQECRGDRPLSFCFNDDVADIGRDGWMWEEVRAFLDDRYPSPSPFEG